MLKEIEVKVVSDSIWRPTRSVLRSARSDVLFFKLEEVNGEDDEHREEESTDQRSMKSQKSEEKCSRGNVGGFSLTIHSINSKIASPL